LEQLYQIFPKLKKQAKEIAEKAKRICKTKVGLLEEAKNVHQLVFASGGKYMPEKEGIRYHVLSMDWVNKWKIYVNYDRLYGK